MNLFNKLFGRLGNNLFQGAYIYAQMRKGEIDDIYVQSPEYFEDYKDEIKKLYSQGIEKSNKVAIHVRRGDYVNNPFYVDLTQTNYYEKAMAEFPGEKFLVFSDDIKWCEEYFIGDEFEFDYSNETEAFSKMAGCKGVITANSSFSWWAGFLCDGKVVAPSIDNWYTDGVERTKTPREWIRI